MYHSLYTQICTGSALFTSKQKEMKMRIGPKASPQNNGAFASVEAEKVNAAEAHIRILIACSWRRKLSMIIQSSCR
jgi:hypothetical protein